MPNGYRSVELSRFGGLDLRRDPLEDTGGIRAIDMLNVDVANDGRLRSRPGTTKLASVSTATAVYKRLFAFPRLALAVPYLITSNAGAGTLISYNASTGAVVDTSAVIIGGAFINDVAMIGTPTATNRMYIAVANGAATLYKYDAVSNFTAAAAFGALGSTRCLAVQYPDNRLVAANFGSASNNSRVQFSDPNAPETWTSANFVDLLPGDGEEIVGMANFRSFLIVFKHSKFFVFFGNTTDATGGTVFNYRTIETGLTIPPQVAYSGRPVVAGDEGVYFLAKDGVYLTDGGYPRKVSAALDPLFVGADDAGYFSATSQIGSGLLNDLGLYYAGGLLFITLASHRMFVYNPKVDAWMYWELSSPGTPTITGVTGVQLPGATREVPHFVHWRTTGGNNENVISYLNWASTADQGHTTAVGFPAYYQTNYMDLGDAGNEKVVREIEVEGYMVSKPVGLHVSNARGSDSNGDFINVTTTPWLAGATTWPAYKVGQGRARWAHRGRDFSLKMGLAGTSGEWALHRAMLHLKDQRPAGVKSL